MDSPYEVEAPRFAVSTRDSPCWQCGQSMTMASLGVPAGYRLTEDGDSSELPETGTLTYIRQLNGAAARRVQSLAPWMAWRTTKMAGIEYLANVCGACGAVQGDHYVHSEPGAAFFPLTPEERAEVAVVWIDAPLVAAVGGISRGPDWLE